MDKENGAFYITARDLAALGKLPRECVPSCGLVYSAPGTLSYNSPGALGFGVKRAALTIPESVMLLVAPDCCGRNSTILSENEGYASRMFYLRMTEADLITGNHLKAISQAVKEICLAAAPRPRVVVICVTCVDALLGTDVERVCKAAEEAVNSAAAKDGNGEESTVRVIPSYMYALTREGTRPPMTAIRDTIYSLLQRDKVSSDAVNIMGFFSPVDGESELLDILKGLGIKTIRQVSKAKTYDEYIEMGNANFNLVLNAEAVFAAERLKERLGMPYIELYRLYDTQRIAKQYRLFAAALGGSIAEGLLSRCKAEADKAVERFKQCFNATRQTGRAASFAIGQMLNALPFELALSLCKMDFSVPYVLASPSDAEWPFVKALAAISPSTRIYPPTHPSAALFTAEENADVAIGKDIADAFTNAVSVEWNSETEPFGFMAVKRLFDECTEKVESEECKEKVKSVECRVKSEDNPSPREGVSPDTPSLRGGGVAPDVAISRNTPIGLRDCRASPREARLPKVPQGYNGDVSPRGAHSLYKHLSPFSSDQSGAQAVFFDMGGTTVIVDAGGCAGNISGFDERRFFAKRPPALHRQPIVFSACLRDMDAILGRDEALVEKTRQALQYFPDAAFIAYIGTPVPAVIGTDFKALCCIAQKRCGISSISVDTTGLLLYGSGEEKAYKAVIDEIVNSVECRVKREDSPSPREGVSPRSSLVKDAEYALVFGATPLEMAAGDSIELLRQKVKKEYPKHNVVIVGEQGSWQAMKECFTSGNTKHCISLAVSPAGLRAAKYLLSKCAVPYKVISPISSIPCPLSPAPHSLLIIHQQCLANSLRDMLKPYFEKIDAATFFDYEKDIAKAQDMHITGEEEFIRLVSTKSYDCILGDPLLRRAVPQYTGKWIALPHWAVSGQLYAVQTEREFMSAIVEAFIGSTTRQSGQTAQEG